MMSSGYTTLDNQKISGSVPAVSVPEQVSVKFSETVLQTFPPSEAQGKISSGYRPPRDADGGELYFEKFGYNRFHQFIYIVLRTENSLNTALRRSGFLFSTDNTPVQVAVVTRLTTTEK